MPTITVPEALALRLQQHALAQHQSMETLAVTLLTTALDTVVDPHVVSVVQRIQSTPPNPAHIRPAHGALAAALADDHPDPAVGQAWDTAWQAIETQINTLNTDDAAREDQR